MLDLKEIAKKFQFQGTPEELAAFEAEEEKSQAWYDEQRGWETKAYNEKISTEEFNRVRDAIDTKYGRTPTSELLARANQ